VEYVKPEDKTPYLAFTLSGDKGKVTEKFYVTAKALSRLQYIHEAWIGKTLDKNFDSFDAVGAYFEKLFNHDKTKSISKMVIVGGQEAADGKVYADLPFSGFVVPDEVNMIEGAFDRGDGNWIQHVTKAKNASTNTESIMIAASTPQDDDPTDGLPF